MNDLSLNIEPRRAEQSKISANFLSRMAEVLREPEQQRLLEAALGRAGISFRNIHERRDIGQRQVDQVAHHHEVDLAIGSPGLPLDDGRGQFGELDRRRVLVLADVLAPAARVLLGLPSGLLVAVPLPAPSVFDRLLERPEYADHWANKWADLLMVNRKFLGTEGAKSLREWIRREPFGESLQ